MPLRPLIFDHIWLKLFSLVLATLIWLAIRANLSNEGFLLHKTGNEAMLTFVGRPILILCESAEHLPAVVVPAKATVTVRGPLDLLQGLKDEDIDVFVRLTDRGGFTGNVPVHVHVPAGAAVAQVTPLTVLVNTRSPASKAASNP